MVYEYIVSNGKLEEKHRQELKTKRGFSDETISERRFFSGGKYLLSLEENLKREFTKKELIDSGTFIKPEYNDDIIISEQLTDDRIIIPYLDKENKATYIRPHKLGLPVEIQLFDEKSISLECEASGAILTEGEFKAVAANQLGFPTVAVPGISSFTDRHFPRLVKFLQAYNIKELCIIFDNEIKDDPQFSNYKEDPMKRYDTQYYAFFMAKQLFNEGIDVRIGTLPDSWRVDGKIDIDGALAMGKVRADIAQVISAAKPHKMYFDEMGKEAQDIVNRKLTKKYLRSHVIKSFGCYHATRYRGKTEWQEKISNFTIKILATHETIEGVIREAILIDQFGTRSRSFPMPPEPMSRTDSFKSFCMGKGNYIWTGRPDDLAQIWEAEFLDDDGRRIIQPDHVGFLNNENLWLFSNIAIKKDGEELRPDKNNIFWINKKGYKPIPIVLSSGKDALSEGLPYLNLGDFDNHEILARLSDTINPEQAKVCLGWISACCFMEEIFERYNCYPFLFLVGKKGSGKSTIAEILMHFFGMDSKNSGKQLSGTTPVALQRYLGYYSCLPLYVDEFRNTKEMAYKTAFMRNVYNRQAAGKGMKSDFGIREGKIRGTLMIAGEETPEDNALLSRCICIIVSGKKREVNHYDWFMDNKNMFSNHTYRILKNKKHNLEKFMGMINKGREYFTKNGKDDRMALNYSIIVAGYCCGFGVDDDKPFQKWLNRETNRVKIEYDSEHAVSQFLDDILVLQSMKKMSRPMWAHNDTNIYLYFSGLYMIWAQEYRKTRGSEPFKQSAIRDYLKEEDGFLELNIPFRIDDRVRKCMVFDKKQAPESLRMLIESESPVSPMQQTAWESQK